MINCHCHTEGAERPKYLKQKNNKRYFAIAQYDNVVISRSLSGGG
ncbi:hypothetical protein [Helicobacter sp. T3_23-1059]